MDEANFHGASVDKKIEALLKNERGFSSQASCSNQSPQKRVYARPTDLGVEPGEPTVSYEI
jgi:hypothetical protein